MIFSFYNQFLKYYKLILLLIYHQFILISNLSDITTLKLKIIDFGLMKDISKRNTTKLTLA